MRDISNHRALPFNYLKGWRIRLPWFNVLLVDPLEHVTSDRRVEEGVQPNEDVRLDHVDAVQVLAENGRQAHFSQFLQLICNNMVEHNTVLDKASMCVRTFCKSGWGNVVLVPKSVRKKVQRPAAANTTAHLSPFLRI